MGDRLFYDSGEIVVHHPLYDIRLLDPVEQQRIFQSSQVQQQKKNFQISSKYNEENQRPTETSKSMASSQKLKMLKSSLTHHSSQPNLTKSTVLRVESRLDAVPSSQLAQSHMQNNSSTDIFYKSTEMLLNLRHENFPQSGLLSRKRTVRSVEAEV